MTVGELIKELEKLDSTKVVYLKDVAKVEFVGVYRDYLGFDDDNDDDGLGYYIIR